MFERLKQKNFQVIIVSHAEAILTVDFPEAIDEIERVLVDLEIPITEIIGSGGGEARCTQRMRRALTALEWHKKNFEIRKTIDGEEKESISHEIDHVRHFPNGKRIALEIEWNNKDPFFDRDLENFKRLHSEGGISAGIIITRGASMQTQMKAYVQRYAEAMHLNSLADLEKLGIHLTGPMRKSLNSKINKKKKPLLFPEAWASVFVSSKFGQSTTHWDKLDDRIRRGVGNPCPLVLIGLPNSVIIEDQGELIVTEETQDGTEETGDA